LTDIVEAIERIHGVLENISLQEFETDWQRQWLVERGIEIISEASRHLTDEMKARHPEIPWQKVSAIGNVLRHNYENIAAPIIWSWRRPIFRHRRKPDAMSSTRGGGGRATRSPGFPLTHQNRSPKKVKPTRPAIAERTVR
jgi:uncharacterized protein with HEPN domain